MQAALLQIDVAGLVQTGAAQTWLWIGAGGFFLATVLFIYLSVTGSSGHAHHYLASTVIVLWAGIWYFVMASGGGIAVSEGTGGEPFYYARYIDWLITTPLLLLGLVWVAGNGSLGNLRQTALYIVIADVLMILTGVVAGPTTGFLSGLFFVLSSIFFVAVLYLLWGPVRAAAMDGETEGRSGLFFTLATMLTVLWILYPIVWLIAPEGFFLVGQSTEVFFFMVLDVLAKIAFGAILLGGIRGAESSSGQSGGQQRPARVS